MFCFDIKFADGFVRLTRLVTKCKNGNNKSLWLNRSRPYPLPVLPLSPTTVLHLHPCGSSYPIDLSMYLNIPQKSTCVCTAPNSHKVSTVTRWQETGRRCCQHPEEACLPFCLVPLFPWQLVAWFLWPQISLFFSNYINTELSSLYPVVSDSLNEWLRATEFSMLCVVWVSATIHPF